MSVTILARVLRGLEWVAAEEVASALPGVRPRLAAREVTFEVPRWPDPRVPGLRTVDDTFLRVAALDGVGTTRDIPGRVATWAAGLDWAWWRDRLARLRPLPQRPRFDVVASLDGKRSFNRFAMENAVGAAIQRRLGGTFAARDAAGRGPGETDLTVRLMLRGPELVVALRLGVRPAHRRGYKLATGAGTLHPPLAATLVWLAADAGRVVADPFCGDGTIAIETALAMPAASVLAGDIDPARLANARANATRAGVAIGLCQADAGRPPWQPGRVSTVLTNPPWDLAVQARGAVSRSLDPFLRSVLSLLDPDGRVCLVADAELAAPTLLARSGFRVLLGQRVRLAGRISDLVLCAPESAAPGAAPPAGLVQWRDRALAAGLVTADGF